jgi:thermosome
MASEKSYEILDGMAKDISKEDEELLKKIAMTSLTGKGAGMASDAIAGLCVGAVKDIAEEGEIDLENVSIEKKHGEGIENSVLVNGMVIDKEIIHPDMPKRVDDAKIALIDSAFEIEKTEIDAKIQITTPEQMQAFLDEEDKMLKDMVNKITSAGVNVLICQKGIDDLAQHYLAKEGVVAIRRVKKSDMEKLSRATGAKIITNAEGILEEDLGEAGLVEERKIGDDKMLFVEKCKNPRSVSILLRGATEHVIDELERGANDALHVVAAAVEDGKFLPGGGAPETELSLRLREYASTVGGREQLAIESFAKALEVTPRTLAENAGIDPIDALVEMRSAHEKGNKTYGLDVYTGKAKDMLEEGVIEPLRVKTQAISAPAEVANMILRIDDTIASKGGEGGMPPGGMPPGGMGGMPPGGMGGMY